MFFHLCAATAVWREGTTQFKKNPHSSSRFNWSLRFSIIFQIKELYYFLCIIEIVLNVSKHMIRKWDLLNEQEITLQFRQFQWAFFFQKKKRKKERKRGRSSLCCIHLFPDLSLTFLPTPHPWLRNHRQCLLVLGSDFHHHRARVGSGWWGEGRDSRWLNHLVMQVGDCVCNPHPLGREGKKPFLQTSHHRNIPRPHPPNPAGQPHRDANSYDFWL